MLGKNREGDLGQKGEVGHWGVCVCLGHACFPLLLCPYLRLPGT